MCCNVPPNEAVYSTTDWAQPRAPGVDLPAERQYRHPVALSALRPFVRLSQRLERQVVTPVSPRPAPVAPAPAAAAPPATTPEHRPAPATVPPAAEPAPIAEAAPVAEPTPIAEPTPLAEPAAEATTPAAFDADATSLAGEQFQAVDASVVPVPIESLNRLVLAVDELGSEMTHVRQAIRELTAALTESQTNVARILSAAQAHAGPEAPDPLDAVTGPYVSGAPTPTPFPSERPPTLGPTAAPVAPEPTPMPAAAPVAAPVPEYATAVATDHVVGLAPEHAGGFGDLPILSTGAVQVVIGPIASLDELDDAVEHIRRITGVDAVAVTSFEGADVVLTAELSRALPLASLLRNELGREVASCRLVDGRIVVDFGEAGTRA